MFIATPDYNARVAPNECVENHAKMEEEIKDLDLDGRIQQLESVTNIRNWVAVGTVVSMGCIVLTNWFIPVTIVVSIVALTLIFGVVPKASDRVDEINSRIGEIFAAAIKCDPVQSSAFFKKYGEYCTKLIIPGEFVIGIKFADFIEWTAGKLKMDVSQSEGMLKGVFGEDAKARDEALIPLQNIGECFTFIKKAAAAKEIDEKAAGSLKEAFTKAVTIPARAVTMPKGRLVDVMHLSNILKSLPKPVSDNTLNSRAASELEGRTISRLIKQVIKNLMRDDQENWKEHFFSALVPDASQ